MRSSLAALVLLCTVPLAAQEFTTEAAKAAQTAYETDLQAAREKYSTALDQAALKAVEAGELDEIVRIKDTKEKLKGSVTSAEGDAQRDLWKHPKGYFEKLNDGYWLERVGDGSFNIFAQSTVKDDYIEISRTGVLVRMYDDHTTALFQGRDRDFKTLHRTGKWSNK